MICFKNNLDVAYMIKIYRIGLLKSIKNIFDKNSFFTVQFWIDIPSGLNIFHLIIQKRDEIEFFKRIFTGKLRILAARHVMVIIVNMIVIVFYS